MSIKMKLIIILILIGTILVTTATLTLIANEDEKRITACVNKKIGLVRIVRENGQCFRSEVRITWPADFPSTTYPSIITDRAFVSSYGELGNDTILVDTNDGHVLENYGGGIGNKVILTCDGKRALIDKHNNSLLVDTADGRVIATYENGFNMAFSCERLAVLNKGLDIVMNRAAVGPGSKDPCCAVKLIDTDTGAVIGEYPGIRGSFNCTGELLYVRQGEGSVVNAVTGEIIMQNKNSSFIFSC